MDLQDYAQRVYNIKSISYVLSFISDFQKHVPQ